MILNNNYDKVFISYAKEDYKAASELYDYLCDWHFDPWLDKRKLLGGQGWDYEIKKALKEADFIILLLSQTSVAKRGYVQKEYRLALEYCEEKLDSDIYIIPYKIDECTVPDKLSKYQWIEMKNEKNEAFMSITSSLNSQRHKYINEDKLNQTKNTPLEYKEDIIKKRQTATDSEAFSDVDIIYPLFIHVDNEDLLILNSYIQTLFLEEYNNFRKQQDYITSIDSIQLSYNFNVLSPNLISFNIYYDRYHDGMPHPNLNIYGHNYLLNPLRKITIDYLFEGRLDVLRTLHKLCLRKLIQEALEREIIEKEDESFMFEEFYEEDWKTFDNFYLTDESIVITFNPYKITAYAFGHFQPKISYENILSIHPDLKLLIRIKDIVKNKSL